MTEPLKISLQLKSEEFTLTDKEGIDHQYEIRELEGQQRDAYIDLMQARMKYENGVLVGVTKTAGMYTDLLCRCIYNDKNELVTTKELDKYPAKAINLLFERAQSISGLNDLGSAETKKD